MYRGELSKKEGLEEFVDLGGGGGWQKRGSAVFEGG